MNLNDPDHGLFDIFNSSLPNHVFTRYQNPPPTIPQEQLYVPTENNMSPFPQQTVHQTAQRTTDNAAGQETTTTPRLTQCIANPVAQPVLSLYDYPFWTPFDPDVIINVILKFKSKGNSVRVAGFCPFCDVPLGPRVDAWFVNLPTTTRESLADELAKIWHLSTPANLEFYPNARTLQFISDADDFCRRHAYETMILPLAHQFGWPKDTDFQYLSVRIRTMAPPVIRMLAERPWLAVHSNYRYNVSEDTSLNESQLLSYLLDLRSPEASAG